MELTYEENERKNYMHGNTELSELYGALIKKEEREDVQGELDDLERKNENLEDRNGELDNENGDLERENDDLQREIDDLTEQNKNLETYNVKLQLQIDRYEVLNSDLTNDAQEYKKEIIQLENEINNLRN